MFDLTKAELIWTWDNGEVHPTALLCAPLLDCGTESENLVLSIPSAWGALHSCWHGQLHLHARHVLVVCDETGQYGLWQLKSTEENPARVFGWCLQPCAWAWLGDARSSALVIEAARQIVPDARGELVGDLMDIQTGNKVNPPGVKVLLGSSHYEGTDYNGSLVINEAGQGRYPRLLGRLTRQGVLLCGQPAPDGIPDAVPWGLDALRWTEMGCQSEGMMAVRAPENGLWGYVDRSGRIAIAPQFDDVGDFAYGTAVVRPAHDVRLGLIDKAGVWVQAPNWRTLQHSSRRLLVAETPSGEWGAVDVQGRALVSFMPYGEWLEQADVQAQLADYGIGRSWRNDSEAETQRTVIEVIAMRYKRICQEKIRQAVEQSLQAGGNLAGLAGLFDSDTTERDLRKAGVWGLSVKLRQNTTQGLLQPCAGETGRIACYYPVSLSIFDLSLEAPVSGLPSHPEAAIGIPWENLLVVTEGG